MAFSTYQRWNIFWLILLCIWKTSTFSLLHTKLCFFPVRNSQAYGECGKSNAAPEFPLVSVLIYCLSSKDVWSVKWYGMHQKCLLRIAVTLCETKWRECQHKTWSFVLHSYSITLQRKQEAHKKLKFAFPYLIGMCVWVFFISWPELRVVNDFNKWYQFSDPCSANDDLMAGTF